MVTIVYLWLDNKKPITYGASRRKQYQSNIWQRYHIELSQWVLYIIKAYDAFVANIFTSLFWFYKMGC